MRSVRYQPMRCERRTSRSAMLIAMFSLVASCGMLSAAERPDRAAPPFGPWDPDTFFEQIFGKQTDAERRELAKVEVALSDEQHVGKQALEAFLAELRRKRVRIVSRGPEVEYLRSLVAMLRPRMRRADRYPSITVLLAESPETDAKCFPGGTLLVFRGMLDFAESEAALVAVLAHELSHIDHGHQLRQLKAVRLAGQQTFAPGNMEQFLNSGMVLGRLFARPFQPEDETEADADAAAWAYQSGYDPRELARLFQRLQERGGQQRMVPAYFRTHPYHADRSAAVLRGYRELHAANPRDDLYIGRENLRRRVPRSRQEFPE
ncbi:MAG: hypothetical protein FJ276_07930 [Planctomycetes bacterium]|nr:hypothetical protein [Planctomycetota bacterium]